MRALEHLRQHLARADALLPLSLVGIASGLITGLVIIGFRLLIESGWPALGVTTEVEAFETLSPSFRVALPVAGGLALGLLFARASVGARQVGVVHVMECLAYNAGRLPWRNAVLQFFGGAVAIVCGHSVGREGPVIHVGAASSSLLGQWLGFPNNSLRTLVACGTAASIAASFNTPIAGVIFAMEVVLMEYTLLGFTPVILAAVCATTLTRLVYGPDPAFDVPSLTMTSLRELPYILLVGFVLGTLAAGFIGAVQTLDRLVRGMSLWWRMSAAGLVTGLAALVAPEVMGIGYDTVQLTVVGELGVKALLVIGALKLLSTTACIGLGVPGGLIGPTVVMGALVGAFLGAIGHALVPEYSSSAGFYAMLGMGAMMGATLQAPLAALMAILELTANPNSILPGMVAIVTATLTSRVVFRRESIFVAILRTRGLEYRHDPVAVALGRTGVTAVMSRRFCAAPAEADAEALSRALASNPEWVTLTRQGRVAAVVPAARLAAARDERASAPRPDAEPVVLVGPDERPVVAVRTHATLREALDAMDQQGAEVALVTRSASLDAAGVRGVLTREQIESGVRYRR